VLDGAQIPVVPEFHYLGIVFHQTVGVSACTAALSAAGMRAMWCMLSRASLCRCLPYSYASLCLSPWYLPSCSTAAKFGARRSSGCVQMLSSAT
jgi:hypothetical protein